MFVLLLSPLAAVVWIWGDALVRHLYGAAFAGHSFALRVLVLNVLIAGAVFPFSRGFFSIQRADLDMAVNVLAVVILLSLGLALVWSYGVAGAALGLAVTNGSTAIIRVGLFGRVTRHGPDLAFAVGSVSVLGVEAFDEDRPAI
jgi:O-antigen/teichoic acid export membrane protein